MLCCNTCILFEPSLTNDQCGEREVMFSAASVRLSAVHCDENKQTPPTSILCNANLAWRATPNFW